MTGPIAVVGAGTIGTTLTQAWRDAGLEVRLGARHPDRGSTITIESALEGADVVVLSVPFQAMDELIPRVGGMLADRIVVCPGNMVRLMDDRRMVTGLPPGTTVGRAFQARLPQAVVVRAFSHFAAELLATRARPPDAAMRWAVAIASDSPAAVEVTARLVDLAGFDPYSLGDLNGSAALDPGGVLFASLLTVGDIRARLG